jgi:formylglycine-generating enzyme required for sulfatase activity
VGGSVVASKLKKESTPANIVFISGGTYCMGSDRHYPEEAPPHRVAVSDFWIDHTPVTNPQFRKFVNETGSVTFADLRPDAKDYPGAFRTCSRRARWYSPRRSIRLISPIGRNGGSSNPAPTRASIPATRISKFHAKCSKAPHTCARQIIVALTSGRSTRATGRYVLKPCRIPACHQKMER